MHILCQLKDLSSVGDFISLYSAPLDVLIKAVSLKEIGLGYA